MAEQKGEAFEALEAIGKAVCITRHGTIPITVEKPAMECFRGEFETIRAALSHAEGEAVELDRYDAGVLGGTDDSPTCWWHDYIRSELDSAHDFYQQQVDGLTRPEPQRRAYTCDHQPDKETADRLGGAGAAFAAGCGGDDYEELGHYLLRTLAEEGFGVFELNTHPAPQVAVPEGWKAKVLELCAAVENDADLPPVKYALKCGRLINEVKDMLAAAPTAPAGEPVTRCTAGLGCDEKGYCDAAATGQGDLCDRRTMAHEQPVSDPDGFEQVLEELRKLHTEMTNTDLVHEGGPEIVGYCVTGKQLDRMEWLLTCCASAALSAPAPDEREIAAYREALEKIAPYPASRAGELGYSACRRIAREALDEGNRLRAGKEGE